MITTIQQGCATVTWHGYDIRANGLLKIWVDIREFVAPGYDSTLLPLTRSDAFKKGGFMLSRRELK